MSTADDWIRWARAKAEAANGIPAGAGQHPLDEAGSGKRSSSERPGNTGQQGREAADPGPWGERQGNREHFTEYGERQGNGEHLDAFGESRGNVECWGPGADEADPRKPGDPPWRGRTAHRTSTPEAMRALRDARLRRGWSISRAADETGISRPHLSLLERGLRRPSESVAEAIIVGYGMTSLEADALSEIAVPWAGRDSPFRTGRAPGDW